MLTHAIVVSSIQNFGLAISIVLLILQFHKPTANILNTD